MPRIVEASRFEILQTWVDASYAIHHDMRGYTCGIISLGHGIIYDKCSKQKMNTTSLTETKVVGASEYTSYTIYTK